MSGLEHYGEELHDLEERLRRLALACDADLDDRNTVVSMIKGDFRACRSCDLSRREELRALLMIKYQVESKCVDELGARDCMRLVEDVDDRLARRGFRHSSSPAATTKESA